MDTIQKTAIKETAKTLGAITGAVLVVSVAISLLSLTAIATIAILYLLAVCIQMIYKMQLDAAKAKQAEIDAKIDALHK